MSTTRNDRNIKIIMKKEPDLLVSTKLLLVAFCIPALLTAILRYVPSAFYGNARVYDKTVPIAIIDDFLSEEKIEELQDLIKRERRFATAVEASGQGVKSIGEHVPVGPDGSCNEPDFYSTDGKTCNIGGRYDIMSHFAKTGGFWGAKETVEKLISSIYSFINYYPEMVDDPIVVDLFKSEAYKQQINRICSEGYGHSDTREMVFHPLQINIVMMPPGKDLPLHQDNQWYWHVNQRSAPDWLLHVMLESQLFDNEMIPQAQGVAYLHGTKEDPIYENGGRYIYYPNGPGATPHTIKPKRGQAIVMDGGRTIHGVERTYPGSEVGRFEKGRFNRIEYQGNDTWYGLSDDDIIETYKTSDFRQTFVWRGLCFENESEHERFMKILENRDYTPLHDVLKKLERDMKKRGVLKNTESLESMGPKEFARLLMKVYMQYPVQGNEENVWFSMNYCALGYNRPWLKTLLSPFCIDNNTYPPLNGKVPPAKPFCDPKGRSYRNTNCDVQ